jgi:Cu/Ag efflux protein CusF
MHNVATLRRTAALAGSLLVLGLSACGGDEPAEAERQSFAFTGSVERVDTVANTVAVMNDDVPGWMGPMSMIYQVDRPEVLRQLQAGDRVRATVYSGDVTTLYSLEEVQP